VVASNAQIDSVVIVVLQDIFILKIKEPVINATKVASLALVVLIIVIVAKLEMDIIILIINV